MEESGRKKLQNAAENRSANKKFLDKLRKTPPKDYVPLVHKLHAEVFACTDCLACANCCKTTSPIFNTKDVERLAKHLKMKPGAFSEAYLRIDEDQDYVLKSSPCPFLLPDNRCSVYEARPKACAEYPHTDDPQFSKRLKITLENAEICPAVADILEKLKRCQGV